MSTAVPGQSTASSYDNSVTPPPTDPQQQPESADEETQEEQLPTLSLGKKLFFSAILFVLMAAVLEFSASTYLKLTRGYDGKHLYEFEFDPYKNILPARNFVDTRGVRHNSVGFRRATEVSVAKPANSYRIFVMGGSAAYGTGGLWPHLQRDFAVIPNDKTIDAFLEKKLAGELPAGTKVEVINAAITSTWTHHHLIYLNQSILKYDPDMVLFLDGFNDMLWANPGHDQFGSYLYNTQASDILGDPSIGALVSANGWWWYRKSAFVHVTIRALRNLKLILTTPRETERHPMDVDKSVANLQQVFPTNALKMHRRIGLILRDENVHPVFMLQPMLILERGKKPMSGPEQKLFEFNVSSYLPNYEQFAHRSTDFIKERERQMAADVGGQFLDLTGIYDGVEQQIFTDYCHLTPLGNEILANYVAGQILPTIRSDLARRQQTPAAPALPAARAAD
ncbi:MAG TPA: hypothetical protein VKA84_22880 [Gemmatimonadaceae bacterium]|nr:hypothetical protein [Gemmatimonadaceae bacterium]